MTRARPTRHPVAAGPLWPFLTIIIHILLHVNIRIKYASALSGSRCCPVRAWHSYKVYTLTDLKGTTFLLSDGAPLTAVMLTVALWAALASRLRPSYTPTSRRWPSSSMQQLRLSLPTWLRAWQFDLMTWFDLHITLYVMLMWPLDKKVSMS